MEHPARLPAAGHWRAAALAAATVAAVELIVLLALGAWVVTSFLGGEQTASAPQAKKQARTAPAGGKAAAPSRSGAPEATLPRTQTSVIVLNGNGQSGAAARGADRVRGLHYLVAGAGNASRSDFARTLVMYRPDFEGEAVRLAVDLGLGPKRAVPLDGVRARDLQGAHVALILGMG